MKSLCLALFALALGIGPTLSADKVVRIGYQKYGTLLLLKAEGSLDAKLKPLGYGVTWTEFPARPQLLKP